MLALGGLVAGVATTGSVFAQQVASVPPASQTFAPAAGAASSNFPIGAQDTLVIDVFDVPDLSRTVQVDNSGNVVLPLIGQISATGRTPQQLSADIAAKLGAKYLKNPIVTVTVKEAASQKITVDGSVVQPGLYEIGPQTTLTQAVALAKGPDQVADASHVAVVRETPQGRQTQIYDLGDIRDGKTVDPYVKPGDTVVVDSSGSRRFVRDYGSLFSMIGFLHP